MLLVLIGDSILDKGDSVWHMILLLPKIVKLICSPTISIAQIAYMHDLVEDYIDMRIVLFPAIRLRPKHHYLLRYASLTLMFGPLIRMWSLRFESKHSYFKRCARFSQNFKNIAKTLAVKHQL